MTPETKFQKLFFTPRKICIFILLQITIYTPSDNNCQHFDRFLEKVGRKAPLKNTFSKRLKSIYIYVYIYICIYIYNIYIHIYIYIYIHIVVTRSGLFFNDNNKKYINTQLYPTTEFIKGK